MIVESEPEGSAVRGIALHLGGFHTVMNFLGCIGDLMDSSGMQEMLESIYAPTAVVHMLSGKAIAQAVHAHFIVDAALNALILRRVLNAPLLCQLETSENNDDTDPDIAESADLGHSQYLDEARTFYEKLMSGKICAEEAQYSDVLEKIKDSFKKNAESLRKSSRTSALWVQYMSMIDILRKFI